MVINDSLINVYVDQSGRRGVEYPIGAGIIDFLATDQYGNYYVYEFKLHRGIDAVVGQICRYIGWIQTHLAKGKKVYGVVVAHDYSPKLAYACSVVPDVFLLRYSVSMEFELCIPQVDKAQ